MGLFDDLTVEHSLPDGMDPAGISFQTKDTAEQQLVRYILRADGTLWNTERKAAEMFHGALEFYTSNWAGSCGTLEMTRDDRPPWRAEYVALFDSGRLLRIDGPGRQPVEGVEHVLSAEFHRRCEEFRRAKALPGDDLHREWVHWMSGIGSAVQAPLEAVKWPALGPRLSYLCGRGAWGIRIHREDFTDDLRDWSAWLSAEPGLPPEAQGLLDRTLDFLASVEGGVR